LGDVSFNIGLSFKRTFLVVAVARFLAFLRNTGKGSKTQIIYCHEDA
jgi:hypothetical protein